MDIVSNIPVFTTRQVAAMLGDGDYARVYLHRLADRGVIRRLKRGCYTVHDDPVVYATHIRYPSYISLWYAFQHHGATTQLPAIVEVMSRVAGSVPGVVFVRCATLWGYRPVLYSGSQVFMADLEKAAIDALVTGRVPLEEVTEAIGLCDTERLEEYALRTNLRTMRKVGYTAERAGRFLGRLHERVRTDRNYVSLSGPVERNRWRVKDDRH